MDIIFDINIIVSFITLVILEIVLGIDNLVFIAILADKLPKHLKDKARYIGLSLALAMRIAMLFTISYLIKLTKPLLTIGSMNFSGKDIILLLGGLFLTFKATVELHERLEGVPHEHNNNKYEAGFWLVILQIVILDAVFSIDSVITAVGMADHLGVMIAAVIVAMIVMIIASKPLMSFVSAHPTVVILCLSFLLMIGFSLIAEGFGFHIPKGYLYAAIGFSLLIELFNQVMQKNAKLNEERRPLRERTAEKILGLIGGHKTPELQMNENLSEKQMLNVFAKEEQQMITGVLTLADRTVKRIMTPRSEITWLDSNKDPLFIKRQMLESTHNLFPVCDGDLDMVIGVVTAKEILIAIEEQQSIAAFAANYPPLMVSDRIDNMQLLEKLKAAKGRLILLVDEYGSIQGLVTPHDILEAIAGDFPDADETPDIVADADGWIVKGNMDLYQLEQSIEGLSVTDPSEDFISVGGLLLAKFGRVPALGDSVQIDGFVFSILKIEKHRIELVKISRAVN